MVSPSGSFLWFPQVGRFCGFPKKKKGFSGQPVTVAEIFLGDYGYPMGTLNSAKKNFGHGHRLSGKSLVGRLCGFPKWVVFVVSPLDMGFPDNR